MSNINITTIFGQDRARDAPLTIGRRYVVHPINPQKKKHRGRLCVIEGFDAEVMPSAATVRFEDTNRIGQVDVSDLLPADKP